jgi:hypothetical protein
VSDTDVLVGDRDVVHELERVTGEDSERLTSAVRDSDKAFENVVLERL